MGEVFLARHIGPSGFERTVVLKRVLPHLGSDPRLVEMLLEEARLLARLEHPNIVQVFELGQHAGGYFLVMEYIHGLVLSDVIGRLEDVGPPVGLGAFVAREVCRALSYAHGLRDAKGKPLGLVHRDVSPSNIMLGTTGSVKLLDFGIAKALSSAELTDAGMIKGKPWYMAPERFAGEPADQKSDIYSVGVVLYEAITARRLFQGEGAADFGAR
jgi:serine/threonine-protein kinase